MQQRPGEEMEKLTGPEPFPSPWRIMRPGCPAPWPPHPAAFPLDDA